MKKYFVQPNPRKVTTQSELPAVARKMSTEPTTIDVEPEPPSGIGLLVEAAFQQDTSIPEDILRQIPAETASVTNLIAAAVPKSLGCTLHSPESCLSNLTPDWTPEDLWKARVPSRTWLNDLEMTMAKGWARKAKAVVVSVGPRNLRFPLWILNFWWKMSEVVEQRTGWKEAQGWMSRMVRGLEIQKAEKLFDRIPWGLRLWPLTGYDEMTRVGFLAELLSNKWLAERHINTLVAYLNDRLRKSGRSGTTLIADQYLGSLLSRKRYETLGQLRTDKELKTYMDRILGGRCERLLFPAHVGGCAAGHWIVFSVDIKRRTFSHGKPLRVLWPDIRSPKIL